MYVSNHVDLRGGLLTTMLAVHLGKLFVFTCCWLQQNLPRTSVSRINRIYQDSLISSSSVTILGEKPKLCASKAASYENNGHNASVCNRDLFGKRKWLGGAVHTQSGIIYGIPAHADCILTIQPPSSEESDEVAEQRIIPLPFAQTGTKFKWLRGVILRNTLYGIPSWCNHGILKVDLQDSDVSILPLPFSPEERRRTDPLVSSHITRWMWHGAATTADKKTILCVPSNAQRVLQIQVETNIVSEIGPTFHGQNKWYGGILGDDGAVYGIPYTASGVLRIGHSSNNGENSYNIRVIGSFPQKQYLWHGGIKSPYNGAIYAFPSHANQVLKISTRLESLGHDHEDDHQLSLLDIHRRVDDDCCLRYQWLGGCIGADGCIYGIPSDSTSILKIDPVTDHVTTFGRVSAQKNKWQGAVLSPIDSCIYCIPSNAEYVLQINTTTAANGVSGALGSTAADQRKLNKYIDDNNERVRLLGRNLSSMKDKFQGGFLGRDGNIYCIPENAKRVLKITPATSTDNAQVCYL